jgi:hypothetical protein
VGYNKIKAFVPYSTVKDILSQQDCLGSRGKWVSQVQEYDLETKPTKIIKGQGLEKMMIERNQEAIEVGQKEQVSIVVREIENNEWYSDIIYYFKNLTCPNHLVEHKRRSHRLKAMKYCLTKEGLGWRNPDEVIFRCVDKEEADKLVTEFHAGHYGGHFVAHTTAHKILREGYYWPTIFSDTHRYVRACHPCQFFVGKQRLHDLPLKTIIVEEPFQQWGLDFIGEFKDNSSNGYRWILTTTNYFTGWVEAIPSSQPRKQQKKS